MLPYPMVSEKFLEINYHLTISGPLLKKALDIAIKNVFLINKIFEDIKKVTEQSYANLFQNLHITGKDSKERTLIVWKLEDIVNQRQLFLSMLEDAIVGREKISLRYLHKTKVSKDDFFTGERSDRIGEGIFNTRYFAIWKTYHFHFIHSEREDQSQSFSYFPLSCLFQGVFLDPDAATRYAGFFYKNGENVLSSTAYKLYLVEQVFGLKNAWESQNIPEM
jgi:hypothetical protein